MQSCGDDDDDDDSSTYKMEKKNKEAGETFLMNNRDNEGVVETSTGLQYKIDTLGTGVKPVAEDSVTMTFTGQLYDGTYFTNSTASMLVSDQIDGMQEGLQLMPEGSTFDLWIPYYLAYGTDENSYIYRNNLVTIAAYSMLHFHVKLTKVKAN